MIATLLLPLLAAAAVLGRAAPVLARRCAPAVTAYALVIGALAVALATGLLLFALAALAIVEMPAAAREGHWSADAVADRASIPLSLGVAFAIAGTMLLALALTRAVRAGRSALCAVREVRLLGPDVDGLIVVEDSRPVAFAVPGRMVVSRGLLRGLDADERRAVLAHEESHVRHRHYLHVQLAAVAAAAQPLLRPVLPAVRLAVERWADEDAVRAVGRRRAVARALAKTATARPRLVTALCMAETDVAARVRHLTSGPTSRLPRDAVIVAGWLSAAMAAFATAASFGFVAHDWFEAAQAAYRR